MDFEDLYNDEPRDSNGASKLSPEKKKIEVSAQEALATIVSRVVLGLILLVSFTVGCWVSATALHQADTCWFLALGRWIYEHGAVPDLDPFSWTMAITASGQTVAASQVAASNFVVSQWLSALLSYLSTLAGGLLTLLILNDVVIVTAFLSLPIGFVVRRGAPFVAGFALVILAMLTALLCPTSCTEIFSYLFIAVFLQVAHHARSAMLWHDDKVFRIAYVLVPLMVLWANLHVGFIFGLLILAGCLLGASLGKFFKGASSKALTVELAMALVGSLLASFATPYGLKLWAVMPQELASLLSHNVNALSYWPYGLLCLAYALLMVREYRACRGKPGAVVDGLVVSELVAAGLVGSVAIAATVVIPGLIVFTTLIVLAEVLTLLGLRRLAAHADASMAAAKSDASMAAAKAEGSAKSDASVAGAKAEPDKAESVNSEADLAATQSTSPSENPRKRTFWQDLNYHSLDVWLAGGAFELAIVSFCSIAGVCLVGNKITKPELPTVSRAFNHPYEIFNQVVYPTLSPTLSPAISPSIRPPVSSSLSSSSNEPAGKIASKAIRYIEQHRNELGDKVFNDAAFGDLIEWQLRATPKVFIDTRLNVYSAKIVADYGTINECLDGWQSRLDACAIDWVFVPTNSKLGQSLLNNSAWENRYHDDGAVIFVRKKI